MTNDNKGIKEKFQLWMSDRWWGFLVLSYGVLYATMIYKTMTDFLTDNGLTYDQLPESKYNRYFWHMYTAIFLWDR